MTSTLHGDEAPGFERVADAFAKNFVDGGEVGGAVAVYADARKVVDLWGGVADAQTGRPWTAETSALVFSVTKGLATICVLKLAQDGWLDLDASVSSYWPEFAQNGKEGITVRCVLAHRAGLIATDRP